MKRRAVAMLVDGALLTALWTALVAVRAAVPGPLPPLPMSVVWPLGVGCVPIFVAMRAFGRPVPSAWLSASLLSAVVVYLAHLEVNRSLGLAFVVAALPTLWLSARIGESVVGARRGLVVGTPTDPHLEARLKQRGLVVHHEDGIGGADLGDVHEVHLVGSWSRATFLATIDACAATGVPLSVDAGFLPLPVDRVDLADRDGRLALTFRVASDADPARLAKRAFDVAGAVCLLVLLAPVLLVAAALVWAFDGGPVLYRQVRLGRYGRPFVMVKLRTMVVDADRSPVVGWPKPVNDPRVTRVGAWLRRLSIDELPQLVHALTGEMSLVGPRPPLPAEAAAYEPHEWRRLSVRPGLTGLWQVSGRADLPLARTMALDLAYVDQWSPSLDLWVLWRTVPAIVSGHGAR